MHTVAYFGLLGALFVSLCAAAMAGLQVWTGSRSWLLLVEKGHFLAALLISLAGSILFGALVGFDFSNLYVSEYTDRLLPLFYRLTAFWAGQDGSLLFWAWMVALAAAVFPLTRGYRGFSENTRAWFWILFLLVQAFFLLLLTTWSNPFRQVVPPPPDGRGLNPLLQNPGMIFHPPLLFLGYGGFTVPACLALAARLSGEGRRWLPVGRTWALFSWIFLTAGIILGGWWSYMELGWGGYWAWDPVENASLIPWLSATAFLHTAVIEDRRGSLAGTNVFLVCLTLILAVFATYLVRSGVVESLHAFGDGGVGGPLLISVLAGLGLTGLVLAVAPRPETRPMDAMVSRPGFLLLATWLLLALGMIILLGTMWPIISKLWSESPVGLDAGFYNRVCLPLFALIGLLAVACPWLGWKGDWRHRSYAFSVFGGTLAAAGLLYGLGVRAPLALVGAAAGVGLAISMAGTLVADKSARTRRGLGFVGIHLGLAMIVLGVAVSGPYQDSREIVARKGETVSLGGYAFTYTELSHAETPAMASITAHLTVTRDGRPVGELVPERRLYRNFEQPFAEVSVLPSLGTEIYAVLLSANEAGEASLKISLNPLVNWLWIGGTLMCLSVFLVFGSRREKDRGQP
jgi:cytochrome c-type biogenesis protein CcmF